MPAAIPFTTIDWKQIPATLHPGETGQASWKTIEYGDLRIRMVEYTPGYRADHWCRKGHIIYCIEGEMITELEDGTEHRLCQGMSYHVSDERSTHKTYSKTGVNYLL